jgi:ESS family glutamate:Na+ symporter
MFGPYEMLMDFGLMSVVLILSHLLRSKIKLLQYIYMPTSLIAGFIVLFCGWQFWDILPFAARENGTPYMSSYPYLLVVVLFGTLFLGKDSKTQKISFSKVIKGVGDTFFYNLASEIGQFGLAVLFGLFVLAPLFPELHQGFALMLPAGFAGGHGYATAIGKAFENYGWDEALTIGYTSATVGLMSGVIGGMLLINIATRLGWTRLVKDIKSLPKSMMTGFVPEKEQVSMGRETISPIALDPFTWHFALTMAAFAVAYLFYNFTKKLLPGSYEIPMMCISMLAGVVIQKILDGINLGHYVDKHVMNRIGSWVTDYLVAFGIASIQVSVVVKYAVPMTILFIFGIVYCMGILLLIAPRIFHNFWFERGIFVFGWNTGVVAIGVTLLRVVDPGFHSKTLEDYGLAYVFISFIEIAVVSLLPIFVAQGVILEPGLVLTISAIACIVLSGKICGWYGGVPASQLREGESEVLAAVAAENAVK